MQASFAFVFGLSFAEIVVILVVGVVVIGPRQLPIMLRSAGRWITKLRRMAYDMRTQSGIDDILRSEGLDEDIRQLRSLLRKGNVLDALAIDIDEEIARGSTKRPSRKKKIAPAADDGPFIPDREYPVGGADAYGIDEEDLDPYRIMQNDEEIVGQEELASGSAQEQPAEQSTEEPALPSWFDGKDERVE